MNGWTGTLTKQGEAFLASLKDDKFTISSAKCGSAEVIKSQLSGLTELTDIIKNMDILSISSNKTTKIVELQLLNTGVKATTEVKQIGLYVKTDDDKEILFAVWQTDTPTVVPKATLKPWSKQYDLYLTFSSLDNVTIEVNIADYLPKSHNTDTLAHKDIRDEIDTLKQDYEASKKFFGDGKIAVASAITDKGVATNADDTLIKMAENIRSISAGGGAVTFKMPNRPVSTLPYSFYYGCALLIDGEIHILGSYDSTSRTKHYKLNKTTGKWESVSTLPYSFYYVRG